MFWVSVEEGIENLFLSHSPKKGRGGGGVGVGGPLVRVLNFWSENIFFVLKGRLIQQIINSLTKHRKNCENANAVQVTLLSLSLSLSHVMGKKRYALVLIDFDLDL